MAVLNSADPTGTSLLRGGEFETVGTARKRCGHLELGDGLQLCGLQLEPTRAREKEAGGEEQKDSATQWTRTTSEARVLA